MRRTCTQCGTCLEHCPIYRLLRGEQASPKAKHLLLDAVEQDGLFSWKQTLHLTRLCAGCGRCADVCPLNLSVPETLAGSRARHPDWTSYAWKLWIEGSGLVWPLAGITANLLPKVGVPSGLRPLVTSAKAMKQNGHPAPWLRVRSTQKSGGETVALFAGCTASAVRPQWIVRARQLLQHAGYTVAARSGEFVCCGSTLHHAGLLDATEKLQRANIALWEAMGRPRIAVFCASCQHGLETYPASSFENADQAAAWAGSIRPLSGLLLERTEGEPFFTADPDRTPLRVAYHQPCHRKGTDTDLILLRGAVPEIHKGRELCCGMGGILKLTHAELSSKLAQACWKGLEPNEGEGALEVVSGCSGCVLQLDAFGGTNRAWHWLDVVDMQSAGNVTA